MKELKCFAKSILERESGQNKMRKDTSVIE